MLVLTGPDQPIPGRQSHSFSHHALGIFDVASKIAAADCDRNQTGQRSSLIRDRWRPLSDDYLCDLPEWNLRPVRRGDQHSFESLWIIAQFALVAHIDGIALPPFDRGRHGFSRDG